MAFQVRYIYDYSRRLSYKIVTIQMFTSEEVKPHTENIRDLSLVAVKRTTVQVTKQPLYPELHQLSCSAKSCVQCAHTHTHTYWSYTLKCIHMESDTENWLCRMMVRNTYYWFYPSYMWLRRRGPAAVVNDRPNLLVREGVSHLQSHNCPKVTEIWFWTPDEVWHKYRLANWPWGVP
jgi:hypothetical protein